MASFVVKHKNLNIKNITFSDVKQTKMGGSNIYLRYKNPTTSQEHNLYVQTPKMFCPFGASSYKQTDSTQLPRYNMNLSFGKDKPELKKFQDKLAALDELVLDKVLVNIMVLKRIFSLFRSNLIIYNTFIIREL